MVGGLELEARFVVDGGSKDGGDVVGSNSETSERDGKAGKNA